VAGIYRRAEIRIIYTETMNIEAAKVVSFYSGLRFTGLNAIWRGDERRSLIQKKTSRTRKIRLIGEGEGQSHNGGKL
jgi:hypothetical protein